MARPLLAAAVVVSLAACQCGGTGDDLPHLEVAEGCQPLLPGYDCLLPYPSDFFLVEDTAQPSGKRVEHFAPARPVTRRGVNADTHTGRPTDGFSRIPFIVAAFPAAVSDEGLVGLFGDLGRTATPQSVTLLLEERSGQGIAHFVDLDPRAQDDQRRALILHPLAPLKERTRYLVAIRGLKQKDGSLVEAPEGFRRLRDGEGLGDPRLSPLRADYEERIFPALEAFGVPRAELQLAWAFTTGSDEQVQRDMLRVRELTLQWLAQHTPEVSVDQVVENPTADIWRRVRGTVTMPLFLTDTLPGAQLHRDALGQVAQNGTATFPFTAQVPVSVRDLPGPGRSLMYGHGFFGGTGELEGAAARQISNRMDAVTFAADWWGMHTGDVGKVADALTGRPAATFDSFERLHQAMANWLTLSAAIERSAPALPAFQRPLGRGAPNDGQPLHAGEAEAFIGVSQGHVLGGVMAALNPDVRRAVLHVGGSGFTHMMFRARPFEQFLDLLQITISDPLEQQKWVATLQRQFDRFDPATYAPYLTQEPLPGGPADRRVLMQLGVADTQVPNLGMHLHARAAGVPQLEDGSEPIFGLPRVAPPHEGSALATYDFGHDPRAMNGQATLPASENEVHDGVRQLDAALAQMRAFFDQGVVVHACQGRCDPE
jgi:hypothetical protein